MLLMEWKKTLIKQKGFLVIIIMILLKVALLFYQGYDSNSIIDSNENAYNYYISVYQGRLTEEKEKSLKDEYDSVTHAHAYLEELTIRKNKEEINTKEYEDKSKLYYESLKNSEVFNLVYNQYHYVKEYPEYRYITDWRGWNTLLSHDRPDVLLLFCLLIVMVPLFCNEYESGMYSLLLSSVKGKYKTPVIKLLSGFVLGATITILFSLAEYLCVNFMVGLNNGEFPLQSLEFFENSEHYISLNQAFFITVVFRIIGAVLFTVLISLISIISKKSIITLFVCSTLVFIPYIIFGGVSILYYLPLPSGLLSGTGYLWGNIYINVFAEHGKERIVQFQNIDKSELVFLLSTYIIQIGFLFLCCLVKYSKHTFKLNSLVKKLHKHTFCLFILVGLLLMFTGCNTKVSEQDYFTYNAPEQWMWGETEKYKITLDVEKNIITAEDIDKGGQIVLTRDPFKQDIYISDDDTTLQKDYKILSIVVRDEWCYYLAEVSQSKEFQIYGINLENFKQELIYNGVKENDKDFFGMVFSKKQDSNYQLSVTYFFLNPNYIYYTQGMKIVRIDRRSKNETVLALDAKEREVVYYKGDIYYVDTLNRFSVYKEEDKTVHKIDSIYTDKISIEGNRIKYSNLLNNKISEYYNIEN
jgi:hypothetical protein